jgi:predicted phage-related endonuclease
MKNLLATLTQYKALKAQLDSLEAQLKEKRTEIEEYMKEKCTDKLTCGQYIATITECTKRSLDEKFIKENYPDIAKEAEKVTTYNRFTVK